MKWQDLLLSDLKMTKLNDIRAMNLVKESEGGGGKIPSLSLSSSSGTSRDAFSRTKVGRGAGALITPLNNFLPKKDRSVNEYLQ